MLLVGAVLCVAVWFHGAADPGALTLPVLGPDAADSGPARAILVLHPDDCPTNWRFLELLGNATIERRLEIVRIAPPTRDGAARLRDRLPQKMQRLPIEPLGADDRRALGRLGYRYGPLLLIFDGEARLRAIEPAPSDPRAFVNLGRRLRSGLTPDSRRIPK